MKYQNIENSSEWNVYKDCDCPFACELYLKNNLFKIYKKKLFFSVKKYFICFFLLNKTKINKNIYFIFLI